MKIAIVTSSYPRYKGDGVGSFIHSLSASLTQLGHRVTVLAPHDPAVIADWQSIVDVRRVHFVWPERWSHLGHGQSLESDVRLKWHAFPLVSLFSLATMMSLLQLIKREKPDVIYAQWLVPGGFIGAIASALTGCPLVISLHGSDVFVAERYRILRPIMRFIFKQARQLIACSPDLAQRAIGLGFPAECVTVIPYGVAVEAYTPQPESRARIRAALGVGETTPVVIAMGRLVYKALMFCSTPHHTYWSVFQKHALSSPEMATCTPSCAHWPPHCISTRRFTSQDMCPGIRRQPISAPLIS